MTALINDIAATSAEFALGLDDYHVIEEGPIHAAVAFTLAHMPAHMHLVIATRAEPPLPLARLRARGQMTELGAHDLRFTIDEAASFLNELMGLDLSVEDVAALEERTEGWIAGLQLAALSMQGREDLPSFIQAFAGSHRYVLDYLAEEVLQRQPEEVQTFLLQTAVLERLTGSLCDALTGQGDAQRMLERLEGANLFITPLDDERRWYRYHNLFADFLRARLLGGYPERIPDLHWAAALWYEQNGSAGEAIKHLLAAEAFDPAADLVEQTAWSLLARGEYTTITSWLAALPEDLVRSRPRLCLAHLRALASARDIGGMQGRLHDLEAVLSSPQAPSFTSAEMVTSAGKQRPIRRFWPFGAMRTPGLPLLCASGR